MSEQRFIEVFGARVHNLKNIDVSIPRNKLVVLTGISGSGKSSLAFDTIYAEGQRRYLESFSAYARQFIGGLERPDVDKIQGDDSSVSYRSLEEKNRAYITNCLNRWLSKWEQELARKTLTPTQRRSMRYYYRFDDWELTRGTMIDRFQAYQIGRQAEILSSNECREFEDLEPREGGDDYKNPAINPQTTGSESKAKPADTTAKAIASRIGHLVNVEKKRILQYSDKSGNFIDSVERFYNGWKDRFTVAIVELGGDVALGHEWATASESMLISVSGEATKETLKETITKHLETWNERETELIANIKEIANA